ncbi:MAG: hypothetical protein ACI906_003675 [Candidatus Latescibacterota bacterium]|jgi:uncharacterized protein YjiK
MKHKIKYRITSGIFALGVLSYLAIAELGEVAAADYNQDLSFIPALEEYDLQAESITRMKLPKQLREISGLAMTHDQRLLAHDDEKGTIFEVDDRTGSIVKSFKLVDQGRSVEDDFEGIAIGDSGWIYLVTSSGRLYEFREGDDEHKVTFRTYATGVGRDCEIESLAYEANGRALLMMCKNPLSPKQKGILTIYRWSVDRKELVVGGHTAIAISEFSRHIKGDKFQPSGMEWDSASGHYFVVAARQRAIAEVTADGQVLAVVKLAKKWHRQAEGITLSADGALIVADEGAKKRARLTLYPKKNTSRK